jgi:hypothetical protein
MSSDEHFNESDNLDDDFKKFKNGPKPKDKWKKENIRDKRKEKNRQRDNW